MKIAVLLPVGPLDRFGYQHNCRTVVESLCSFADRVYMCSTTRNRARVDELLRDFSNLTYIGDERTWFEIGADGEEIYSLSRALEAINLALDVAGEDKMDCALMIHINQYVQEHVREPLRRHCENMLIAGRAYEWLYKKYQLADRLFHADHRVPWVVNLRVNSGLRFAPDALRIATGETVAQIESGDFRAYDSIAIVDAALEATVAERKEMMNFVRCYAELKPGVSAYFDWPSYFEYYKTKFSQKIPSDEPLDPTGREIARRSRPDFVSRIVLSHCLPERGIRRRLRRIVAKAGIKGLPRSRQEILAAARGFVHHLRLLWRYREAEPAHRHYLLGQLERTLARSGLKPRARVMRLIDRLIASAGPSADSRVLCVGCRNTYELDCFRKRGFRNVIGIDLYSVSPHILVMDMHQMTFPDDRFDLVFCCHSLEHALDLKKAVGEIVRVAKPGAVIAVEVPVQYGPRGADLVDFHSPDGVLRAFQPHVQKVLWQEVQPANSPENDEGTPVARVVFTLAKEKGYGGAGK